jgi:general secretion pathway protein E
MDIEKLEKELIEHAIQSRASDIHIEPRAEQWEVRLRIQGALFPFRLLAKEWGNALIQRIKVKGKMNIGEKRLPQDGGYNYTLSGQESYDLRISTLPTIEGEKVTIRILYRHPEFTLINQLGMNESDYEELLSWIREPMGLILVTGPTGAGKTTTLYAILQHLNNGMVHICTIEDPVEIRLPGVNQVQVNEQAGLTFSEGLRSLLRHDPDIIMIGEIRDRETAEIAVRASLTGHLVLATMHTMDAATAVTRLMEMGIEPYLVTSALKGVVAQRMVNHYCPNCSDDIPCLVCEGRRIIKRAPQFELLRIREELSPYILDKRPAAEIRFMSKQLELFSVRG